MSDSDFFDYEVAWVTISGYVSVKVVYITQAQLLVTNVILSLASYGSHYYTEL